MKERGISPIIATVLLVAMIFVIGLIVFLWFSGMTEETITKFGGTNVKLVCDDIQFQSDYSSGTLGIVNIGNVPIFGMRVKVFSDGNYATKNLKDDLSENWPNLGLNQGGAFLDTIEFAGVEKIILIPVLMGTSDEGEKTFVCEERYGYEITIE